MLADIAPSLGLAEQAMRLAVSHYGNTGAASIPITLDATHRAGKLACGDNVLLAAFGGGMNLAASVCTWTATAVTADSAAAPLVRVWD